MTKLNGPQFHTALAQAHGEAAENLQKRADHHDDKDLKNELERLAKKHMTSARTYLRVAEELTTKENQKEHTP
jgi:hypothetical protein